MASRQRHKFGGSSLADAEGYRRVTNIISEYCEPGDVMVVFAAGDTTNQLTDWLTLSQNQPLAYALHTGHRLTQLCYSSEIASAVLAYLQQIG